MKLDNIKINKAFIAYILCVAIYSLFIVIRDLREIYQNALSFFDQAESIYPVLISVAVTLVPISIVWVAYFVHRNRHTYLVLIPLLYSVIFFANYFVLAMVAVVFVWWVFLKNSK